MVNIAYAVSYSVTMRGLEDRETRARHKSYRVKVIQRSLFKHHGLVTHLLFLLIAAPEPTPEVTIKTEEDIGKLH